MLLISMELCMMIKKLRLYLLQHTIHMIQFWFKKVYFVRLQKSIRLTKVDSRYMSNSICFAKCLTKNL